MTSSVLRVSSYSRRKAKRAFIVHQVQPKDWVLGVKRHRESTTVDNAAFPTADYVKSRVSQEYNSMVVFCFALWCMFSFIVGMKFDAQMTKPEVRVVYKDVIKQASFDEKQCLSWMFKSNWKETKKRVCGK